MNDFELLEAAAKAAGLYDDGYRAQCRDGEGWICIRPADDKCPFQSVWEPLTDDGDALRLAVKLGIKIDLHPAWVYARAVVRGLEYLQIDEGWGQGGDPYAATRRAIVRAAAALPPQEHAA